MVLYKDYNKAMQARCKGCSKLRFNWKECYYYCTDGKRPAGPLPH